MRHEKQQQKMKYGKEINELWERNEWGMRKRWVEYEKEMNEIWEKVEYEKEMNEV